MQLPALFDPLPGWSIACGMLSKVVKTLRDQAGLTQVELAHKAGVSQQLITKIENGKVSESRKLPNIAKALGLTVEELLARAKGIPNPKKKAADPRLQEIIQIWADLDDTGREHLWQSAIFASHRRGAPFQDSTPTYSVHEERATYSVSRGGRSSKQ